MDRNLFEGFSETPVVATQQNLAVRRTHLTSLANVEYRRPIRWRVTVSPSTTFHIVIAEAGPRPISSGPSI
jgi:hypothetical protein